MRQISTEYPITSKKTYDINTNEARYTTFVYMSSGNEKEPLARIKKINKIKKINCAFFPLAPRCLPITSKGPTLCKDLVRRVLLTMDGTRLKSAWRLIGALLESLTEVMLIDDGSGKAWSKDSKIAGIGHSIPRGSHGNICHRFYPSHHSVK